jgi:GNAT superfamily N-acetyltransferase
MLANSYHKLNNPAWFALNEVHRSYAIGSNEIKKYQRYIAPWVGYHSANKEILKELEPFIEKDESVYSFDEMPLLPPGFIFEKLVPCLQMVCNSPITNISHTAAMEKLEDADGNELENLINLVQPGYYNPGTRLMGEYYGIRQEGKLVAAAGERICMDGFTEVSGVVTHPDFTGRKYAQQLTAHVTNKNLSAGIIPFLHVAQINERAIKLYEYLGFVIRREINVWKIKKL